MLTIYCDSSITEACFLEEGHQPIFVSYPRPVTCNQGEYIALTCALGYARSIMYSEHQDIVTIKSDSNLVVNQVNGKFRCNKPILVEARDRIQSTIRQEAYVGKKIKIEWVSREENPAGKELEKRK
jgi:ribonuclease HI